MADRLSDPWFFDDRPVLITGGRGFMGSHLALRLCAARPDGRVVAVDNGIRDCFASLKVEPPPNLEFILGDVREPQEWMPLVGRPSVIVHCAALAGVSTYYKDPSAVMEVNGIGTFRLLEAVRSRPPELFVNLSTSETYGAHAAGADEAGPPGVGPVSDPRWSYAASKVFGDHLVFARVRRDGLRAVSLRPFNVYGPGQVGEGAIRNFFHAALSGESLRITGDGSQTRAWLFIDDFVDAVLALAAQPEAWGEVYNVGDPDTLVSIADLAGRIAALCDGVGVHYVPHPGQDVQERWPRTDKLRGATGWSPKVSLDEGLKRTMAFWKMRLQEG
jgi:nucleoside-diphosphate-sugar epimerase